jgi:hypothetical protein
LPVSNEERLIRVPDGLPPITDGWEYYTGPHVHPTRQYCTAWKGDDFIWSNGGVCGCEFPWTNPGTGITWYAIRPKQLSGDGAEKSAPKDGQYCAASDSQRDAEPSPDSPSTNKTLEDMLSKVKTVGDCHKEHAESHSPSKPSAEADRLVNRFATSISAWSDINQDGSYSAISPARAALVAHIAALEHERNTLAEENAALRNTILNLDPDATNGNSWQERFRRICAQRDEANAEVEKWRFLAQGLANNAKHMLMGGSDAPLRNLLATAPYFQIDAASKGEKHDA